MVLVRYLYAWEVGTNLFLVSRMKLSLLSFFQISLVSLFFFLFDNVAEAASWRHLARSEPISSGLSSSGDLFSSFDSASIN